MSNKRTLWSILSVPPPGHLPSDAPGTGPAQGDSSQVDTARGGGRVPPNRAPNETGYGGGGDVIDVASQLTADQEAKSLADRMAKRLQRTPPGPAIPQPNHLYDGVRSEEAWRHSVELTASQTFTPATGSITTAQAVLADQGPLTQTPGLLRLDQFPRGTHALPVLVVFSAFSVAATGTGTVEFLFQSQWGSVPIPLGGFNLATAQFYSEPELLVNAPIVDPGLQQFGTMYVVSRSVATPVAMTWRLGIGFAYLVPEPALQGYRFSPSVHHQDAALYRRTEG